MNLHWGRSAALAVLVLLAAGPCRAESEPENVGNIVGVWKTYDDETGRPAAVVRIVAERDAYVGRVEQVLDPEAPSRCAKCTGARHDQPIVGMQILTGLRRANGHYAGGEILDPDDGRVYRAEARLIEHGRHLSLRGYIGLPILGRSQVWQRMPEAAIKPGVTIRPGEAVRP
jgi:uncharacterized protein (DUF2147 family)